MRIVLRALVLFPGLMLLSRAPMVRVAIVGKGTGAPARPRRYLVLCRRGHLAERMLVTQKWMRTGVKSGAMPNWLSVVAAPSNLVHFGAGNCMMRMARSAEAMMVYASVEVVGKSSASMTHLAAAQPLAAAALRRTRAGCRCGVAGQHGCTCPARAATSMTTPQRGAGRTSQWTVQGMDPMDMRRPTMEPAIANKWCWRDTSAAIRSFPQFEGGTPRLGPRTVRVPMSPQLRLLAQFEGPTLGLGRARDFGSHRRRTSSTHAMLT